MVWVGDIAIIHKFVKRIYEQDPHQPTKKKRKKEWALCQEGYCSSGQTQSASASKSDKFTMIENTVTMRIKMVAILKRI